MCFQAYRREPYHIESSNWKVCILWCYCLCDLFVCMNGVSVKKRCCLIFGLLISYSMIDLSLMHCLFVCEFVLWFLFYWMFNFFHGCVLRPSTPFRGVNAWGWVLGQAQSVYFLPKFRFLDSCFLGGSSKVFYFSLKSRIFNFHFTILSRAAN